MVMKVRLDAETMCMQPESPSVPPSLFPPVSFSLFLFFFLSLSPTLCFPLPFPFPLLPCLSLSLSLLPPPLPLLFFFYISAAENAFMCKICWEAAVDCVLLECGHMLTCVKCGRQLHECPVCRHIVTRVVHAFRV